MLVTNSVSPGTGTYAADLTVTSAGTIAASNGPGVYLGNGTTLFNQGLIIGRGYYYKGNIGYARGGVSLYGAAYLNNAGTINGGPGAFYGLAESFGTANNTGTIIAVDGNGVDVGDGGTFTNSGLVSGGGVGLATGYVNAYMAPATIINTGTIEGGTGIDLNQGVSFTNTGLVTGQGFGVSSSGDNFTNDGTISGGSGISTDGGVITNAGTVIGGTVKGDYGMALSGASLTNDGFISGYIGINAAEGGTIVNNATIFDNEVGILLDGATSIINNGKIEGGMIGVQDNQAMATLTNAGFISGQSIGAIIGYKDVINNSGTIQGGFGVAAIGQGGVVNTGLIEGGTYAAAYLEFSTLINAGTITGVIGVDVHFAHENNQGTPTPSGPPTVITSGFIGGTKDAVLFNNTLSYGTLIIDAGAVFSGSIISIPTTNTMQFAANPGNAAETGTLGGFGTTVDGWATLQFDQGASFTIEGDAAGFSTGEKIVGFAKSDSIILDGFVVDAADTKYVSGVGLELTSTQGNRITLDITGSYATGNFVITSEAGKTDINVNGTASGPSGAITLSAAKPNTIISSPVVTYAAVGVFGIAGGYGASPRYLGATTSETVSAALFGPAGTQFTVQNKTLIESSLKDHYSAGIVLGAAGTVLNAGTIIAANGIMDFSSSGNAYLENTGKIFASFGIGIDLQGGGSGLNTGTIDADTTGIFITGGTYAYNSGTINARTGIAVAGSTASYIYNIGKINAATGNGKFNGTTGDGVDLVSGGLLNNARRGTITGLNGAYFGAAGTVYNYGTIQGRYTTVKGYYGGVPPNYGLLLTAGGVVYNYGFIGGTVGISGGIGTAVYNYKGARIIGASPSEKNGPNGYGVNVASGVVYNAGLIETRTGVAIGSGKVTNLGTIDGTYTGVKMQSGTLFDSGTIIGNDTINNFGPGEVGFGPGAIYFFSGYGPTRLILTPTARIEGAVDLNGAALELAADGKKIGTLAPPSWTLANPGDITIDSKAIWDFAGTFTFGAVSPVLNDGTIKEGANDLITIDGPIAGRGLIKLGKEALTLGGAVAATQKIKFTGTGETLALGDAPDFQGKIKKFAIGDTIDLTGVSLSSITGTQFSKGVLTIDAGASIALTFTSPSAFGSDVFLLTSDGTGTGITLAKPKFLSAPDAAVTTISMPGPDLPTLTPNHSSVVSGSTSFIAGHIATYLPQAMATSLPQMTLAH
jgi:hypothetical protein